MAQIAGLQDLRKQGPPGDIGTFVQPATALVFQFTFSGTTTIVAMAVGVSGWVLIDQGAVVATVINAALTAAGGAVDGEVVVLEGAYAVLATLSVPEGVLFRGVGWATIFNYDAGGNCITITGDNAKVRDLKVVITAGAGDVGTRPNCIYAGAVDRVEVNGCWVVGDRTVVDDATSLRQTGIVFNVVTESKISGCTSENHMRQGIYLLESPNNTITGNICTLITYNGIYLYTNSFYNSVVGNNCFTLLGSGIMIMTYYNTITGNSCTDSASGITLTYGANFNTVTGNNCSDNSADGIYLIDQGITVDYNTLTGNTCNGNGSQGISMTTAVGNTVTGNTCQGNTVNGIYLRSTSTDNTVSGNTCQGSTTQSGIYLWNSIDNTITGNTCQGNDMHGIRFSGATGNVVSGNTCQGNTERGMEMTSSSDNNTIIGNAFNENVTYGLRAYSSDFNVIVGNSFIGNDSLNTGTFDGIHLTSSHGNLVLGNMCRANDRWGIYLTGSDFNKVSNNYTEGNTAGSITVSDAACDNTQVEFNTVEEGAPVDAGTNTRAYGNYDPSANAFVGDVGVAPF